MTIPNLKELKKYIPRVTFKKDGRVHVFLVEIFFFKKNKQKPRKRPAKTFMPSSGNSGAFSVTPTLDAHEAAVFALNDYEAAAEAPKVGYHLQ